MLSRSPAFLVPALILCFAGVSLGVWSAEPYIRGAWHAEEYIIKDGPSLPVDGLAFFAAKDWTALFFVTVNGKPERGAGEGGTYTLDGEKLVLTHLYHLSTGKAVGPLPESPLRIELKDVSEASIEPCTVEVEGEVMTIHFGPTGNAMTFKKSSDF